MNNVTIMGRLTADPVIRYTKDNKPVANFTLADNGRNDKTLFLRCTAFNEKQANFVQQYLTKGTKVVATGRLESDEYTDKNGQKVYNIGLTVTSVEFAESKPQNSQPEQTQQPFAQGQPFTQPMQQPFAQGQPFGQPMQQPFGMAPVQNAGQQPMAAPFNPALNPAPMAAVQPTGMQGNPMTAMPGQPADPAYSMELPFN